MKHLNLATNVLIIAFIVFVVLRFRRKKQELELARATSYGATATASSIDFSTLDPINFSTTLSPGYAGSEVLALQMMLQHYHADQPLTGVMDEYTIGHLDHVRAGIREGDTNLNGFAYSFFVPEFGDDAYAAIIEKFNS